MGREILARFPPLGRGRLAQGRRRPRSRAVPSTRSSRAPPTRSRIEPLYPRGDGPRALRGRAARGASLARLDHPDAGERTLRRSTISPAAPMGCRSSSPARPAPMALASALRFGGACIALSTACGSTAGSRFELDLGPEAPTPGAEVRRRWSSARRRSGGCADLPSASIPSALWRGGRARATGSRCASPRRRRARRCEARVSPGRSSPPTGAPSTRPAARRRRNSPSRSSAALAYLRALEEAGFALDEARRRIAFRLRGGRRRVRHPGEVSRAAAAVGARRRGVRPRAAPGAGPCRERVADDERARSLVNVMRGAMAAFSAGSRRRRQRQRAAVSRTRSACPTPSRAGWRATRSSSCWQNRISASSPIPPPARAHSRR